MLSSVCFDCSQLRKTVNLGNHQNHFGENQLLKFVGCKNCSNLSYSSSESYSESGFGGAGGAGGVLGF